MSTSARNNQVLAICLTAICVIFMACSSVLLADTRAVDVSSGTAFNKNILGQCPSASAAVATNWKLLAEDVFELTDNSSNRGVAGGLEADTYDWRYFPSRESLTTLEFLKWATEHDTEPFITVNTRGVGAGSVGIPTTSYVYDDTSLSRILDMAEQWVRYTNIILPTYRQGDVLAPADANVIDAIDWTDPSDKLLSPGEPNLLTVAYWEIGNEPMVPIGSFSWTPSEYRDRYKSICSAMFAVDGDIMVGPCITTSSGGSNAYLNAVLADGAAVVDFVSYHPYDNLDYTSIASLEYGLRNVKSFQQTQKAGIISSLSNNGRSVNAPLAASEWNVSGWESVGNFDSRTMAHALGCAETIFTFAELNLFAAHYWNWPNDPDTGAEYPVYKLFEVMRDHIGDMLLDSYTDGNNFRMYTTKSSNSNKVVIWGLNFSDSTEKVMDIQLSNLGFTPKNITLMKLKSKRLSGDTGLLDATRQNNTINIDWESTDITGLDISDFTLTFEDAVITAVVIEDEEGLTEDFDNYSSGWFADPWGAGNWSRKAVPTASQWDWRVYIDNEEYYNSSSNIILVEQSGGNWQNVRATHEITPTDFGQITFDALSNKTSDLGLKVQLYSGSDRIGYFAFSSAGGGAAVWYSDIGNSVIGTYQPNQWYAVKADWDGDLEKVYITFDNGTEYVFDYEVSGAGAVDRIELTMHNASTDYIGLVDNLIVVQTPSGPTALRDDFEGYELGWPAGSWTRTGSGGLYDWNVEIIEDGFYGKPNYSNNMLVQQVGSNWQHVKATHTITATDKGRLNFAALSNKIDDLGLRVELYSGSDRIGYFAFGNNGDVLMNSGWRGSSGEFDVGNYIAYTWYDVELGWDGDSEKIFISFNNDPNKEFDYLASGAGAVDTVKLVMHNESTYYQGVVDDIEVYDSSSGLLVFEDDFETYVPGWPAGSWTKEGIGSGSGDWTIEIAHDPAFSRSNSLKIGQMGSNWQNVYASLPVDLQDTGIMNFYAMSNTPNDLGLRVELYGGSDRIGFFAFGADGEALGNSNWRGSNGEYVIGNYIADMWYPVSISWDGENERIGFDFDGWYKEFNYSVSDAGPVDQINLILHSATTHHYGWIDDISIIPALIEEEAFAEDFDTYSIGEWPIGTWKREGKGGSTWRVEVVDDPNYSNSNSLRIAQVGDHWAGVKASHIIPETESGLISFYCMSSGDGNEPSYPGPDAGLKVILYSDSNEIGYFCFGTFGNALINSTWDDNYKIGAYEADIWYLVKMEWRADEEKIYASFDNGMTYEFNYINSGTGSVDEIVLTLNNEEAWYDGWVDDIVVVSNPSRPQFCGDEGTVYLVGDLDENCTVDFDDLKILVGRWLECSNPADNNCDQFWK